MPHIASIRGRSSHLESTWSKVRWLTVSGCHTRGQSWVQLLIECSAHREQFYCQCSWDTRIIFTVMPSALMIRHGPFAQRTINFILEDMTAGFLQLETGDLPVRPIGSSTEKSFKPRSIFAHMAGQRIASDYDFAFTGSKGDLEWHQMTYMKTPYIL